MYQISQIMKNYLILTIVPAILAICWALVTKIRQKDWADTFFVFVAALTLIINGLVVNRILTDAYVPLWMLLIQLLLSPTIVPQAYMYFCRQLGTKGSLGTHIALWALLALLLVPSLCIDIHPFTEETMCQPLEFMHFNIFNHGVRIYSISIPSLIILIQAIITIARIPIVVKALRIYELKFTTGGRSFISWWSATIVFCVASSLIEMQTLQEPMYSWMFFITYSVLISFIFGLIGWGVDLHPLQTSEDEQIENMDDFIEANKDLAQRAQRLFMQEKLYLRPGIVIDDVVKMLNTNRTYFTRMMRAEFNMSFNEYITKERIEYAKLELHRTEKTMEEIAMDCGFANASSFCRVFKRITDVSPDAWRKNKIE